MNYLSHAKRKRRNLWIKLISVILGSVVIGLFARGVVVRPLSYVSYYFSNAVYSLVPQGFRSALEQSKENQALKDKILLLVAENADRNVLSSQNEELKSKLGRSDKQKVLYATVLEKPPISPFDTFILDVGSDQGVKLGDTVVVGNLAVGDIIDVGNLYSKAELFSSPERTFTGNLAPKGLTLQAVGKGNGTFEALLPIGSKVAEGDALILPSISSKVFGLVEKVEELPEEGFKKILFGLPINPSEVSSVGIIIK